MTVISSVRNTFTGGSGMTVISSVRNTFTGNYSFGECLWFFVVEFFNYNKIIPLYLSRQKIFKCYLHNKIYFQFRFCIRFLLNKQTVSQKYTEYLTVYLSISERNFELLYVIIWKQKILFFCFQILEAKKQKVGSK